jgi:tetratricopeptide repeat protein
MRSLYLVGGVYSLVCGYAAWRALAPHGEAVAPDAVVLAGPAGSWFQAIKPYCNALEAESRVSQSPPPAGRDGAGYEAACFALAGRIGRARQTIARLPEGQRGYASWIVFNIGHPVADAGDDRSAGPIMELVLEFWPDNYQALYHAGMSEYALGQPARARAHLQQFVAVYQDHDGWRANALDVLGRMEQPER